MDDPLLVRRLERLGDCFRDRERFVERESLTYVASGFSRTSGTPGPPSGGPTGIADSDGPAEAGPHTGKTVGQRRALDVFEDEGLRRGFVFEAVNRADVRMVERSEKLRFALEPRQPIAVVEEGVRENLDGDVTIQFAVAGAIDFAHSASAELRHNLVFAEARPMFSAIGSWSAEA